MPENTSPMDCGTALKQLWDYLDDELTVDRMQSIHVHLQGCGHCLHEAEFAEHFLDALRKTREERVCPKEVRSRVLSKLREAGFHPS